MDKNLLREKLSEKLKKWRGDSVTEVHNAVGEAVMEMYAEQWQNSREKHLSGRRAAYFSMEFLVGRAIQNNLLCLGIYDEVADVLRNEFGFEMSEFEEIEDAALGNGGLGRLAACFLDSAATLDLPLDGYGIRYKYGLFKQYIVDGFQREEADDWSRSGDPWSKRCDEAVLVKYSGQTVIAVPYDMPIFGCKTDNVGTLRLWQAVPINEFDFDTFNKQNYLEASKEKIFAEDISRVLYPNDDKIGRAHV